MNPEIKAKWLRDLNSGELRQGIGQMRHANPDGIEYCCWGVLDRRARLEGFNGSNAISYPSAELLDWCGIDRQSGPIGDIVVYLATMNDEGSNFPAIGEEVDTWL